MAKKKNNDVLIYGGLAVVAILIFIELKKNAVPPVTSTLPVQNNTGSGTVVSTVSTLLTDVIGLFGSKNPAPVSTVASQSDISTSIDNISDPGNNNYV